LHIPEKLVPENQPESKSIDVLPANPLSKPGDPPKEYKSGEYKSKRKNRTAQKNVDFDISEEELKRYTKERFDPWKRRK
jgi:hypothetical protein